MAVDAPPARYKFGARPPRYYDGSAPDRTTTACPDCTRPADPVMGDHGGECVDGVFMPVPSSALGVVRALALSQQRITVLDLRDAFLRRGISAVGRRRAAVQSAVRREWLKVEGNAWRSLIVDSSPNWDRR